jgi:Iron-sulfur cluster binding domain of dihydroorotate dehydrogenase B
MRPFSHELCYHPRMRVYSARVTEVRLDPSGRRQAWIGCPPAAIPAPGQYSLACATAEPDEQGEILHSPLFPGEIAIDGFLTASPVPLSWEPGTSLELHGPLGHGFHQPENAQSIALAAFGDTPARLLPLVRPALDSNRAVALFSDGALPLLPPALEAHPLSNLAEALPWADFIAVDLPGESLADLRRRLGLPLAARLQCPAQALIITPMPCGGVADCGACAVSARRGWKLACKDGPVFDLETLNW